MNCSTCLSNAHHPCRQSLSPCPGPGAWQVLNGCWLNSVMEPGVAPWDKTPGASVPASVWNALPSGRCLKNPFSSFKTQARVLPPPRCLPLPKGPAPRTPQMSLSRSYLALSAWPGVLRVGLTLISAYPPLCGQAPCPAHAGCSIGGHKGDSCGCFFYLKNIPSLGFVSASTAYSAGVAPD